MSISRLRIFFKVGTLLAITPTSPITHKSETTKRKVYAVVIFILLASGAVYSTISRKYEYFFMKNLFLYHNDAIFVCQNFYVIIAFTFWKRAQWTDFMEKLKISDKITQLRPNSENRVYKTVFLMSHVVFVVATVYNARVWFKVEGILMFQKYGVRRIETYVHFYYCLFLSVILRMLLTRYKRMNHILEAFVTQKLRFYENTPTKIGHNVCFLKETVDVFNELFGWPIFFIIFQSVLQVLTYIHFMITSEDSFEIILVQITLVSLILFMTVAVILMCSQVTEEAQKLVTLTYKLRWSGQSDHVRKQELYEFTNLVARNLPTFTAANFFVVDKNTILQVFGTVNTLLVILIQLSNK